MKIYFHIDQARKTCVTAYLTLRTESNKHEKLRDFWEEIVMVCIMIVLLDQCCLAVNIVMCLWIFSWIRRDGRRKENFPSKHHYNPVIGQRFGESNIQGIQDCKANQTKLFQAVCQENERKLQAPGR